MSDRPQRAQVTLVQGARMKARVGDFEYALDLPERLGGTDSAPTPTEQFVASIAACELFYAYRYLERRGVKTDGATATVTWESSPKTIERVKVEVAIPGGLEPELVDGCLKMMNSCFVTRSAEAGIAVVASVS